MTAEDWEVRRKAEEAKRQAEETRQRLDWAGIPPKFRGVGFDDYLVVLPEQKCALEIARRYAENFADHLIVGRSLVFMGGLGTGKTHLVCAILQSLAHHCFPEREGYATRVGYTVRYSTSSEIIRNLRDTWRRDSDRSEDDVLRKLVDYRLLAIDEVGVGYGTDAEKAQLTELIDARYRANHPTLIATNLDRAGLSEWLGERACDRLRDNGGLVAIFDWESYRGKETSHSRKELTV